LKRYHSRDGLRNRNFLRDCEEQVEGISPTLTIGGPGELDICIGNGIVDMTTEKKESEEENYDSDVHESYESSSRLLGSRATGKRDIEELESECRGVAPEDLEAYYKFGNTV